MLLLNMSNTSANDTHELQELYHELVAFVRAQFEADRQGYQKRWGQPLSDRLASGHCVTGLTFQKETSQENLRFEFSDNFSDFREGDLVRLHVNDPFNPLFDATIVQERNNYLDLQAYRKSDHRLVHEGLEYTIDGSYIDLEAMVLKALEQLSGTERGRERILRVFNGDFEDEISLDRYDSVLDGLEGSQFNDSQQDAIARGVAAELCFLIQGPPGTGKTRVLAQIVAQRFKLGERILITALTHRAIHEALNAIQEALPDEERIAKIGVPIIEDTLRVPQYERFAFAPFATADGAYIIGATPFAARSSRLGSVDFDTVVFDEASQLTTPMAIMAMLSGNAYVIIGDPKQLPPVVSCLPQDRAKEASIFSRLQRKKDLAMLDVTFRMNREISEWTSERFYLGRLKSAERNANRSLQLSGDAHQGWLQEALNPEQSLIWITRSATEGGRESDEEADIVNQLVESLFTLGVNLADIGIISPFRKQGRHIRRRLQANTTLANAEVGTCVVDTVERMQGQEREVIIIATSAADPGFLCKIADFIYMPERLNVAVTRARSKVITIAHDAFLDTELESDSAREAAGLWRSLLESSHEIRV